MVHTVSALFYLFMGGKSIDYLTTIRKILDIPPWGILGILCKIEVVFLRGGQVASREEFAGSKMNGEY